MKKLLIALVALTLPVCLSAQVLTQHVIQPQDAAQTFGTIVSAADRPIVNVRDYGCKGDGATDDTACMVLAGNAVVTNAAVGPVTLFFPSGRYMVNPLNGMSPWISGLSSTLFNFPTQSNIDVLADSATIALLPYTASAQPAQTYAQQVGVTAGAVFNFQTFLIGGSHIHFLGGLTLDGNGQSQGNCAAGCFWMNGVFNSAKVGDITAYSITGGTTAIFTATNNFTAGQSICVAGLSVGTALNLCNLPVISTGLSSAQFEVTLPVAQSNIGTTADLGVASSSVDIVVSHESFMRLNGWPAVSFSGQNVRFDHNYAEHGEGFVCANGAYGCVIDSNTALNSFDAPFACDGGGFTTYSPAHLVTNCNITNNVSYKTSNGAGVDITATQNFVVSHNNLSNSANWGIQVGRTGGAYNGGPNSGALASSNGIVSDNTLTTNSIAQSFAFNSDIVVGDNYVSPQLGTGGTPFTAGSTAANITVENNHIFTQDSAGNGIGVGYGAAHIKVANNTIRGCGNTLVPCGGLQHRIVVGNVAANTSISDVTVVNNTELDYIGATSRILLNATIDRYTAFGNNMDTVNSGTVTTYGTTYNASPVQIGSAANPASLTLYGPLVLSTALGVAYGGTGDTGTTCTQTTPTPTPATGAITTASSTVCVKTLGKTAFLTVKATVTTAGTGAGDLSVVLPFTAGKDGTITCREAASGLAGTGTITSASTALSMRNYLNATFIANGAVVTCSGIAITQ